MGWLILDYLLHAVHLAVIGMNCFGWASRRTRRLHLVVIGATAASWFVMGAFRGWGYCFLTDWHWRVKAELGQEPAGWSYITHVLRGLFDEVDAGWVHDVTLYSFVVLVLLSLGLNMRDVVKAHRERRRMAAGGDPAKPGPLRAD